MSFKWNTPRHIDGNYCISPEDMRQWEQEEINAIPNRGRELMEIAGRETAQIVLNRYPDANEILIFCGPGNNGGDGFAAAWYLKNCGIDSILFVFDSKGAKTPDAQYMFHRVKDLQRRVIRNTNDACRILEWTKRRNILVIDAIFGTGYRPRHDILMNRVYQCIEDLCCPIVSVDIPSGIDAHSGYCGAIDDDRPPRTIAADLTITFGAPKFGHFFGDGPAHCGELHCVDIGLNPFPNEKDRCMVLSDTWCKKRFENDTRRKMDTHKGDCGHVLVIGGSQTMPGAASLSARAALRAGAGLVTLASRAPLRTDDEIMVTSICDDSGLFLPDRLQMLFDKADCILIGPGLSRDETTLAIIDACQNYDKRIIFDADALWAISEQKFTFSATEIFVTPHPAEAARLLHQETREILYHPIESARKIAEQYAATTILKSHVSLVASRASRMSNGKLAVNPYPNPAIATAGSGDAFAGILAGILAQARSGAYRRWLEAFDVASLAVHIHSKAGRNASITRHNSVIASDIIDAISIE